VLFDSHCHLTDERLAAESADVLRRAREVGVTGIVTIASDADDAVAAAAIAGSDTMVWCTAGVHPHRAAVGLAQLPRIRELAAGARCVAIGETGLDYHYDTAPRDVQRASLRAHVELAAETGLPLVVHSREAHDDTTAMLRDLPAGTCGVLHCFSGGAALMDAALAAGWYISFAGMVSFRTFDGADLLRAVPADRLLIETDSPYLAPVPHRGRRNEPAYVRNVAESVAMHLGVAVAAVIESTGSNARTFYGIPDDA
jgi:TatD DNase family protein